MAISHAQKPAVKPGSSSILHQPLAVWAIAFACAVSFMGIGLVDPILPAISRELDATPAQTMLLFTSYLLITAMAMFFAGFVSSRLGVKRTLLLGLALVVVFAACAGAAGSVDAIIGFRGGWGLGNALFISTALAGIVGAATGGSGQAVILYEAALGIGMAAGPLLGGVLGEVSWRAPFFGTATLMAIAFLAITLALRAPAGSPRPEPISATAGFRALREPALLTLSVTALFYNYAFFTLLAYSPYPLEAAAARAGADFGAHELGLVFFGWGLALAITSVLVAPILTRRMGLRPVLFTMMTFLTFGMAGLAIGVESVVTMVVLIVTAGLFLGVMNTAMTETVMEATQLPRNVASSTYSGVRFLGGAIAPAVSGGIASWWGAGAPFWFAAGALCAAMLSLAIGSRTLSHLTRPHETAVAEAADITAGDAV